LKVLALVRARSGAPQRLFRHAGRALLVGEEERVGPAQHLALRVPREALGARVPALDAPLAVEHHDGVVAHVLDDQPVARLRAAELGEGLAALSSHAGLADLALDGGSEAREVRLREEV